MPPDVCRRSSPLLFAPFSSDSFPSFVRSLLRWFIHPWFLPLLCMWPGWYYRDMVFLQWGMVYAFECLLSIEKLGNWRSRSKEAMVVEGLLWPEYWKKRIPHHLIVSSLFLRLLTPIQYPRKMDEKPSGEFINTYLTFNKRYHFNEGDCWSKWKGY